MTQLQQWMPPRCHATHQKPNSPMCNRLCATVVKYKMWPLNNLYASVTHNSGSRHLQKWILERCSCSLQISVLSNFKPSSPPVPRWRSPVTQHWRPTRGGEVIVQQPTAKGLFIVSNYTITSGIVLNHQTANGGWGLCLNMFCGIERAELQNISQTYIVGWSRIPLQCRPVSYFLGQILLAYLLLA